MRILIVVQGWYGERIARHILQCKPGHWEVDVTRMPSSLPQVIEEPRQHIPGSMGRCQLLIVLSESPSLSSLIPDFAWSSGAEAIIAPIDDDKCLPRGMRSAISQALEVEGVAVAFPKTFCLLEANTGNRLIDEFAQKFGRPELEALLEDGRITAVKVIRGSPCGCTTYVAEKIVGIRGEDAELRSGLLLHGYPCLASVEVDRAYGDSLMHISAYVMKGCMKRALLGKGERRVRSIGDVSDIGRQLDHSQR
jgi:hypothetical protein